METEAPDILAVAKTAQDWTDDIIMDSSLVNIRENALQSTKKN